MNTVLCNAAIMAWTACALTMLPVRPTSIAFSPSIAPTAALGDVYAIGVTDGTLAVYVATSSGLYRSASPTLSSWTKQGSIKNITALSPDPRRFSLDM